MTREAITISPVTPLHMPYSGIVSILVVTLDTTSLFFCQNLSIIIKSEYLVKRMCGRFIDCNPQTFSFYESTIYHVGVKLHDRPTLHLASGKTVL